MKLLAVTQPAAIANLKVENFHKAGSGYIDMDGNIDVYMQAFAQEVLTEFKDQVVQVKKRNLVSFKIN